ncbi:cytochrome c oxidase assembly factor 7-like [Physella acuta]|uniref:cytochrome c oxidase assembly factor 7-like n=1 Tax=Physella acuta TaxID=109671 RepID=UPI0027DCEA9A|nr:cytochrome c oxidase assembly factor 7-like [Physella acuta]
MAYDLTTDEGVKEYLRDIQIEYQFQCLDQKEPDGCHRLADFMYTIRQQPSTAAPLYKENCDKNNYPESCFKYGNCLAKGIGMPEEKPDLKSAFHYFEKSCEMNYAEGCHNAGFALLSTGSDEEKKIEKCLTFLNKSCDLKCKDACFSLAGFYLEGEHVDKDLKKAFEFNQKGCNLGMVACCSNLSLMYKYGHGTEKNLKMAATLKQKAADLSGSNATKQRPLKVNQ